MAAKQRSHAPARKGLVTVSITLLGLGSLMLRNSQQSISQLYAKDPTFTLGAQTSATANAIEESSTTHQQYPTITYDEDSYSSRNNPHQMNDEYFDLIFWSEQPMNSSLPHGELIVTREYISENALSPSGEQVLTADFRLCNDNCPIASTEPQNETNAIFRFQRNENRKVFIYVSKISMQLNNAIVDTSQIKAITFWSSQHKQHIPIKYAPSKIETNVCGDKKKPCPEHCPQNHGNQQAMFPYIRDSKDGVCKSTHPDALPPTREHGGICRCESTCFTEKASSHNSTWPWEDENERRLYQPYRGDRKKNEAQTRTHRQCRTKRRETTANSTYQARFSCSDEKNGTLPCPIFGDFSHHLYFIPKAKLIFCGIPKVGMTEWIKFFRHVIGAKDYLSLPHYKYDRRYFFMSHLPISKAQELLDDPTWTKAVFFRNPLERLLSAYMDKIVGMDYTQKIFKLGDEKLPRDQRPVLSFPEFVDKVTNTSALDQCKDNTGLKACTDPHWKPQVMTCGLDHLLPKFDFIGRFDHISEHTKMLLEKVGIWDDFGATFDDGKDQMAEEKYDHMCWVPPVKRSGNETILGFNQRGPSGTGRNHHATGSQSRFDEMYTPELIEKVRQAYHLDVAIWDEIKYHPTESIANGKDLKVVQQHCNANEKQ